MTKDLARRIGADIASAVKSPELTNRIATFGMEPVGSTPDEYDGSSRSRSTSGTRS